ncbi:MAG TPA: hypothetical protein VFU93_11565 [Acidimicrobiales bacterium]|nr:hypothetical protein [Acidimicrobiales bacterium]
MAGDDVRFGATTWFHDVLVRFGYDLFEHEHPWDGEWIDDAFESAAIDLRSTGAKLLRALEWVDDDPLQGPLTIDLVLAYLRRILDDLAIVIPNCYGVEGRSMPRGDLAALGFPCPVDLDIPTHSPTLYMVVDAAGPKPSLPKATARTLDESGTVTIAAVVALDAALAQLCTWLDDVLATLQREIAKRADDGDDLLARWADPDWSVVCRAIPAIAKHLPVIG